MFAANSFMQGELQDCVIMDKTTTSDGYDGVVTTWVEGAPFKAAIIHDDSVDASIANSENRMGRYIVYTSKSIVLQEFDVFKRLSDGKIMQVTKGNIDTHTPATSRLDLRKVRAQEHNI